MSFQAAAHSHRSAFLRYFLRRGRWHFPARLIVTIFVTVRALSVQTPDETVRRIQALIQKGDLATAREELTKAIKAAPRDASLYNLQGVVLAQQADLARGRRI